MGKWLKFVLGGLIVIWLLMFPVTKAIIVFLLPVGSGWDDALELILIVGVLFVLGMRFFRDGPREAWRTFKKAVKDFLK